MATISAASHRMLDFATVAVFAISPSLLHLGTGPRALSYLLAAVHMAMTLATRFNSRRRPVSFAAHGYVELLVGPALLITAALAPWPQRARLFYAIAGTAILAVWTVSSYGRTRVALRDDARTSR